MSEEPKSNEEQIYIDEWDKKFEKSMQGLDLISIQSLSHKFATQTKFSTWEAFIKSIKKLKPELLSTGSGQIKNAKIVVEKC